MADPKLTPAQAAAQYNAMHQHEVAGTSFASPDAPSDASKAAFLAQQAATKAAQYKAIEAERQQRLNWMPQSFSKAIAKYSGKRGK